jgi:Chitobiase/beta-hexosaminidase C-terminal domain
MHLHLKWLVAFVILCASGLVHAQSCSNMALGIGANLNGFVPFPATNAWNTNIAADTPDPNSAAIVAAAGFTGLSTHVNFGSSVDDGGIPYVVVDSTQTSAVPINVIDYASESDVVLAPYPPSVPIEGEPADCTGWPDTYQGDAHVLVLDRAKCFLYETFNTNRCNGQYDASSETIWDMKNSESRPWGWTSADAAGLPVFPGLVRYDEVASGAIHHAIRFTMQHTKNDANDGYFVAPATHAAGTDWGVSNIMGMRIRLKANFDISGYSAANQVILTALKQYGMILADNGGNFYIQGATDPRWDDNDLADLAGIPSSEFDVMPMTPEFPGYDSATAPTGTLPAINAFTATATSVSPGAAVTFDYNVSGASYDFIDMIGPVTAGIGSVTINPTATQTYTLYSTNAYGQTVSTPLTVKVTGSVVAAPIFAPAAGSYPAAQSVTLSTATYPYATIYYTTDGSTPTYPITGTTKEYPVTPAPPESQGNVNSITVSSSATVRAIALAPGYSAPSSVGSAAYVIGVSQAATPVFSPAGGTFTSAQSVKITTTTTTGSPAIYYTTDGTTPTYPITGTTKLYSGAISVSASETLNAITVATGFSNSGEGTASFVINLPQAATPTFNPPAGTYGPAQSVRISTTTTTGSPTIYYTTDGSLPSYPITGTTKLYSGAITVSTSETLKAITAATGLLNSAVGSASYTINNLPSAATPTFTVAAGTYTSVQTVMIQSTTSGAAIYYTTDGSDPATSSTAIEYSAAISVSVSETVKAVAEATNYNNSAVGSAAYIINLPFPGPRFVQACNQEANYAESVSCTLNGVSAGHTLVISVVGSGIVQSATVTSTSGTPTLAVHDGDTLSAYILPNTGSGTISITATISANQTFWLSVYEYSNTAASPLDGTAFAVATGWTPTSFSSPDLTTTSVSDTLWSYCLAPGGYTFTAGTAPIPWTALPSANNGYANFVEDGPTTSAGTYYGQCGTGSGVAVPEIITLALKPSSSIIPAALMTPTPGSTLTSSSATFNWTTATRATGYILSLGTTGVGSYNLYYSGSVTATSATVNGLPTNGVTIYARLTTNNNGTWVHNDYTYKAATLATITAPTPGSVLVGSSATFTWTPVSEATGYILSLGTTGAGSYNLYYSGSVTATSATFSALPDNGATIYARLTTNFNGTWVHNDYTYTSAAHAALTSPAPSSTLTGTSATFTWTTVSGATGYILSLGTTGAGSYNLYYSGSLTVHLAAVSGLPANGGTIYARLTTNFNGTWEHADYTYTAATLAALTVSA